MLRITMTPHPLRIFQDLVVTLTLSATKPIRSGIEMDMVQVLAVAVGRKHRAEAVARGARDVVEKGSLWTAAAPIIRHQNDRAALELESGNIDGVAAGVLAPAAIAAILAPAGIRAEIANATDAFTETGACRALDYFARELLEPRGKRAADETRLIPSRCGQRHAHRI